MMFCAFRIQDLTQYSADSGQPGNGAEWCDPVAPEPSARPPPGSSGQSHEAGPEFISTPLTPPRPAPAGSALGPHLRHGRRLFLPPLVPCHGASSALSPRLSSLHLPFSPSLSASPSLGVALCPAPPSVWDSASSPLRPAPCLGPSNPCSSGLALHVPIGLSGAPRPRGPAPLPAPPFTQSLAPALRREGAALPGPALPPAGPTPAPAPGPALI